MILDYIEGPIDGDSWEELINSCYRIKYGDEHYTEIPATHRGDGGIEGFTRTGKVYQCYCPERNYSDDDLHGHLRDKMTRDINKLISPTYAKIYDELGVPQIHEWHFVVPKYKDSRIIKHAETKRKELMELKKNNPGLYDYIADDFVIVLKVAEDFKVEITRLIRTTLTDNKLNLAIYNTASPNWNLCDSDKLKNIRRKVKAVMGNVDENDEDYLDVVNSYVEAYLNGIEILRILRLDFPQVYEDIYTLEQRYKREVTIKTKMNTNSSINSQLFNEILDKFEVKLEQQFKYLTFTSVMELKTDLVGAWLADCSMEFKSR